MGQVTERKEARDEGHR